MPEHLQRRRFFKSNAKNILYSSWINQIFVFFVLFAYLSGINSMKNAVSSLAYQITDSFAIPYVLMVLYMSLSLLLIFPLLYGVIKFEICCIEKKNVSVSVMFDTFSSVELLLRSYSVFLSFLLRVLPLYVLPFALGLYIDGGYYKLLLQNSYFVGNVDVVYFLLNLVMFLLYLVSFVLTGKRFVGLYISVKREDLPVARCFQMGNLCSHSFSGEITMLNFTFVPLVVISMFSLGVLFVIYTLPYILLTFTGMSDFLYERVVACDLSGMFKDSHGKMRDINTNGDSAESSIVNE